MNHSMPCGRLKREPAGGSPFEWPQNFGCPILCSLTAKGGSVAIPTCKQSPRHPHTEGHGFSRAEIAASAGRYRSAEAGVPGQLVGWGGNAGVEAQPERLIFLLLNNPSVSVRRVSQVRLEERHSHPSPKYFRGFAQQNSLSSPSTPKKSITHAAPTTYPRKYLA